MISGLTKLNIVQFLDAISENFFRMLIAYYLIFLFGLPYTARAAAETGALFLIPFLLFSTPGGLLSDRFSKKTIITVTRICQLVILLLTFVALEGKAPKACMGLLFLFSSFSALFAPSKYGILPEIYPKERLIFANSIIAAFTYLGIILGIGLSSLFLELSEKNFSGGVVILVACSITGILFSFALPNVQPQNPLKRVRGFIYSELFISIVEMRRLPRLYPAVKATAYFLFLGTFVQLNMLPFAENYLNLDPVVGGYLFLITALGIGIGAFTVNKLCRFKINLMLVPYSGFTISALLAVLAFFSFNWWLTLVWLFSIGFFAGIFLVPAQTYILATSPSQTRGRNYSTANFLSFLYALFAPLLIFLFQTKWKFGPAISFFFVALINTAIMFYFLAAFKKNPKTSL